MKTTEENNRMIAEFLGWKKGHPEILELRWADEWFYEATRKTTKGYLHFDTSWDWLMPVVEKIEKLGFWTECRTQLGGTRMVIGDSKDFNHDSSPTVNVYKDIKLDAVYTACIKFAEWYNEQMKS